MFFFAWKNIFSFLSPFLQTRCWLLSFWVLGKSKFCVEESKFCIDVMIAVKNLRYGICILRFVLSRRILSYDRVSYFEVPSGLISESRMAVYFCCWWRTVHNLDAFWAFWYPCRKLVHCVNNVVSHEQTVWSPRFQYVWAVVAVMDAGLELWMPLYVMSLHGRRLRVRLFSCKMFSYFYVFGWTKCGENILSGKNVFHQNTENDLPMFWP